MTGNFSTVRQKTAGAAFGGSFPGFLYTLHDASVSVSYGLDLWGGERRAIEEAATVPHVHRMELWRSDRRVWTFEAPDALREAV